MQPGIKFFDLFIIAFSPFSIAQTVERIHIVRRVVNRLLEIHHGFLIATEAASCISAIEPYFSVARVSVSRFYEERDRFFMVAV
jgi:hypothetical protein